jgi:hypothetical protein
VNIEPQKIREMKISVSGCVFKHERSKKRENEMEPRKREMERNNELQRQLEEK